MLKSKFPHGLPAAPADVQALPVTTAAASAAVILNATKVELGEVVYVEAFVRGYDSTADEVSIHRTSGLARNAGGTVTLIDADVNSEAFTEGSDDSVVAIVIDNTSDTIRVQATGNSTNGNKFSGEVFIRRMSAAV